MKSKELILKKYKPITKGDPKLTKAAKIVKRNIDRHFTEDGWPLDYSLLVEDVFQEAFKEQLESYLLKELNKSRKYRYVLSTDKKLFSGLVLKRLEKTNR